MHLLQTNYANVTKQNEKIEEMNSSMQEIFQRLSSPAQLPSIKEGNEEVTQTSSQTSPVVDKQTVTNHGDKNGEESDEVEMMAELISDLVVKKLSELDAAE